MVLVVVVVVIIIVVVVVVVVVVSVVVVAIPCFFYRFGPGHHLPTLSGEALRQGGRADVQNMGARQDVGWGCRACKGVQGGRGDALVAGVDGDG